MMWRYVCVCMWIWYMCMYIQRSVLMCQYVCDVHHINENIFLFVIKSNKRSLSVWNVTVKS